MVPAGSGRFLVLHAKVAFSSPVKFCKCFFRLKFRSSSRCKSLDIRLFYRKLSNRKRGDSLSEFHRNSLKYSNDQTSKLD